MEDLQLFAQYSDKKLQLFAGKALVLLGTRMDFSFSHTNY